ncbi:mucin-20 [Nycticebus coucang]|uniref:mucin-20 n=1 Tax=Nycticebus coucang TaxID=9470 RepID=UPI00234C7943|nr:mucin-20 [Nycticebus coucang]
MGSLWGLALPLLFCWDTGLSGSSAGPHTGRPDTWVTADDIEVPTVTAGPRVSSEEPFQTPDLTKTPFSLETQTLNTKTFSRFLIPDSIIPEAGTRESKTVSPATETTTITKITPPKFMVVITAPMEMSATSGSSEGTGMTTVQSVTGSDPVEAIFDTLCTNDSSEEAKRVTVNILTLAHTSREAEGLSSESSSSSDSSGPVLSTSQALAPAKGLVTYTITHIEVTNCTVTEIETIATISGISDIGHSPPEGAKALSTSDISALLDSTEVKSYITKSTTSAETLSTVSATESAAPDATIGTPPLTSGTTERETTADKATSLTGTLVTVSMDPLGETSALSLETPSHIEVSEAVTVPTEAWSTVGKVTSSSGSSASVYSPSEIATIKSSTPAEMPVTDSTTNGLLPTSRSPLPSICLATGSSSQRTNIASAKVTTSAKTTEKPPTATATSAQVQRNTTVLANGDGGFLLLQLSVASPEDLTDPRVAERFMWQLRRNLHAHLPPIRVSLLRVRRV